MPTHTHASNTGTNSSGSGEKFSPGSGNALPDAGGDAPHNNMPPFVVLNYIIKT